MMARVLTVSMMLLLVGCPKSGTEPPKEPGALGSPDTSPDTDENGKPLVRIEDSPAKTAEDIVLDGFRLGDSYAELIKRTPYQDPCDDDPVDAEKTTRAMVYGGLPCPRADLRRRNDAGCVSSV